MRIVAAKLVLVGQDVPPVGDTAGAPLWRLQEIGWRDRTPPTLSLVRDDVAEIIFTSGATAEPKGVVITHRNVLANIVPVEREIIKRLHTQWQLPEPLARAVAYDVVDAVKGGRSLEGAVDDIAHTLDSAAAGVPLTEAEHREAKRAFELWEHAASEKAGFSIKGAIDGLAAEVHGVLVVVQNHERRLHELEGRR